MTLRALVFAEDIMGFTLARDLCDRVLAIDTQGDDTLREQMRRGISQARAAGIKLALAIAHQESEAWVLAGFVPEHDAERELLLTLAERHGFDPAREPHRLTPNRRTDPHDAKRACASLFPEGTLSPRAERCWLETLLETLERSGSRTGLPEYLADVRHNVMPLLGGRATME